MTTPAAKKPAVKKRKKHAKAKVERRADLVSKLGRELTRGGQAFELGQLPLHFKQTKVCIFKLTRVLAARCG